MEMASLFRTIGGLGTVLGILAGALWIVRRYDLRLPGRAIGVRERRLELVETLPVDARRTIALVRRDGREHLVLIAPEGHLVLETALVRDAVDDAADEARRTARIESTGRNVDRASSGNPSSPNQSFAALVERVRGGVDPVRRALGALRDHAVRPSPDLPSPSQPPSRLPSAQPERSKHRHKRARGHRISAVAGIAPVPADSPPPAESAHRADTRHPVAEDTAFA